MSFEGFLAAIGSVLFLGGVVTIFVLGLWAPEDMTRIPWIGVFVGAVLLIVTWGILGVRPDDVL